MVEVQVEKTDFLMYTAAVSKRIESHCDEGCSHGK